jgi:hypothetical protein
MSATERKDMGQLCICAGCYFSVYIERNLADITDVQTFMPFLGHTSFVHKVLRLSL